MEQVREMEHMMNSVEEKLLSLEEKPSTRIQACQLLAKTKDLQKEVTGFELPDLEAEYTDEEGDRLDNALDRYNTLRQKLADLEAKAETLCVCWNKLDQDVTELTHLLTSGGGSTRAIERLEKSIGQLRDMFTVRDGIMSKLKNEDLQSTLSPAAAE